MGRIKQALTRKLGPLPAWAWAGVLLGAVLVYRRYTGGGRALVNNTGTPTDNTSAPDRQEPVVLSPGESVYDPNTGQLLGGGPAGGDGADDGGTESLNGGQDAASAGGSFALIQRLRPKKVKTRAARHRKGHKTPRAQATRHARKHPKKAHPVNVAHAHAARSRGGTVKTRALAQPKPTRQRPTHKVVSRAVRNRPAPARHVHPETQRVHEQRQPHTRRQRSRRR
jgi:hypothetical protein